MRTFMAGAASTGLSVASSTVVARSSARPWAILASRSALAGAITTRSAARDSSMWPISDSSVSENSALCTGLPLSAESESGVTNWAPPAVSTQRTSAARSRRRRIKSRVL